MEFCPKCGAILMQKTKNTAECPRCNYSSKNKTDLKITEKIKERKEIPIVSPKDGQVLPVITEKCKQCKNKKAYFWTVQTRAADEAATKFFRCTKCNHTWREYD
jgi:DNA-directed RNA polymerase subunit M